MGLSIYLARFTLKIPGILHIQYQKQEFLVSQRQKMDIYSFGVLILEMLTGKVVAPENRHCLFRQIHHEPYLQLVQRCLSERPIDRPSAGDIISELR